MESAHSNLSPQMQEAIRHRAEEIYFRSGGAPGHDLENWRQAEAEILRESAGQGVRRVVVKVEGVLYTGEYELESADGYAPGEFQQGEPVAVRLEGDKLFLRRPNGQELRATVVKKQAEQVR
jgi:hypothetical protein